MGEKRPGQVLASPTVCAKRPAAAQVFAPRGQAETAGSSSQHRAEKIMVALDADLLQCCVCSGPLTTTLFQDHSKVLAAVTEASSTVLLALDHHSDQERILFPSQKCTKGHISCSECCTDVALDGECECLMCREPQTATRCRAMERLLAGVSVPCPFRQLGCGQMIPYAGKAAHEASCPYAPCHCPIPGCGGYAGKSLRDHVEADHPAVHRTRVRPGCLTPLRMRSFEQARVVWLGSGGTEFLLVAGRDVPSGRSLSVVGLMDELFQDEFKYRIEVVGKDGVLALSGQAKGVERLARPYQASTFLFVPNAFWDAFPEDTDIPVFIHLK